MKKILFIFLTILTMTVVLTACGNSIPKGMTKEVYDYGCKALEIMEKYNAAEISGEDAKDRLESLKKSLDAEKEKLTDVIENGSAFLVSSDVQFFIFAIGGNGSTFDVEKSLRKELGK